MGSENFVMFTDFFVAKPLQIEDKKSKDFFGLFGPPQSRRYRAGNVPDGSIPKKLGVRIAATHSGKVTGNNGFYLPDKMRVGTDTWTNPYQKPILLHHEKMDDAIGRVQEAKYIDISAGFRNDSVLKRAENIVGDYPADRLIDAFLKGELEPRESVDVVRNVFLTEDFNYTKDASYPGLGYIELVASISDSDAIQKIIDERFLMGSIGARTDAAVCSVCKKDWAKDGMCDHRPGKEYEGVLCVVIAGNLTYSEYSYVNSPADTHSKNIEIFMDGERKDSIDCLQGDDKVPEVSFNIVDSLTEFEESKNMSFTLQDAIELVHWRFKDTEFSAVTNFAQSTAEELYTEDKGKFMEALDSHEPSMFRIVLGDELDEILGENPTDSDIEYVQMLVDAKLGNLDMTPEEVTALLDAKLSAKKRKALSGSTFCGPERSFPVNDCPHYTAALRLIGRYKGPGDKGRIRACIERKGKRMGCSSTKKKDSLGVGKFDLGWFDDFSDTEVQQLANGITASFEERELAVSSEKSNPCKETMDKISKLETENAKVEEIKQELQTTLADGEQLRGQLITLTGQLRDQKADTIITLKRLNGDEISGNFKEELLTKTDKELSEIEKELSEKVDIVDISEKIKPRKGELAPGSIQNPVLGYTIENDTSELVITKEYMDQVTEDFYCIRMQEGNEAAQRYLEDLKSKGLLPSEMPEPTK
jgi:hypothetical protein